MATFDAFRRDRAPMPLLGGLGARLSSTLSGAAGALRAVNAGTGSQKCQAAAVIHHRGRFTAGPASWSVCAVPCRVIRRRSGVPWR